MLSADCVFLHSRKNYRDDLMNDSQSKPAALVLKSHAKVNLYLDVLGRRDDGFHEVETVMHEVSLADTVTLCDEHGGGIVVECDTPGIPLDGTNLAWRAAEAIRAECSVGRGVRIRLEKVIPAGGGLGGGSSNAATVLCGLNAMWGLGLSEERLMRLGAGLGSDVPFFVTGGTAVCSGRGERVRKVESRARLHFVLVAPGIHVSTAEVYRNLKIALTLEKSASKLFSGGFCVLADFVSGGLYNKLEEVAYNLYPEIKKIKETVARVCSGGALLCGSGSTVFGLCATDEQAQTARRELHDKTGHAVYKVESFIRPNNNPRRQP